MATKSPARRRTAFVASAAVLTVVTATSMAGAHEGNDDADSIHACVASNGSLRVSSDADQDCRRNETSLHWTTDVGDSGALDDFKTELMTIDHATDLVRWSNLADVPEWLQDGTVDFGDIGELPGWLQDGTVDFADLPGWLQDGEITLAEIEDLPTWLQDGTVSFAELVGSLPTDSVTGAMVDDGTLTAADLAGDDVNGILGAVTSEKVLDGSLTGLDLANGSVSPDDLSPVVASSTSSSAFSLLSGTDMPSIGGAEINANGPSVVMVTGQVQLSLDCFDCARVTQYQVVRIDGALEVPVSPTYEVALIPESTEDVASISIHDTVEAGPHAYWIRLSTAGGSVSYGNAVINVQVLGRTG